MWACSTRQPQKTRSVPDRSAISAPARPGSGSVRDCAIDLNFKRDTDRNPRTQIEPPICDNFHGIDGLVVINCGRICLHRKKINISIVLAGQRLGIKEVDKGSWVVSFKSYDLGFLDLEQRTLQPLDNPFGPRLLPMS
jgi:hypothetical protein